MFSESFGQSLISDILLESDYPDFSRNIIKTVEVKRRNEVADRTPEYTPLWIIVTMAHGYSFENWLDWPQCEDNWPCTFDKVTLSSWAFDENLLFSGFVQRRL